MSGSPRITVTARDGVATLTMDDGKVNAMSPAMLTDLHDAFEAATSDPDTKVILLASSAKVFSAGFDLSVFASGLEGTLAMLRLGAELAERILGCPKPVVTACAGHTYPMGAFLMLAADLRLAAEGDYTIGMNEVKIGLTLPQFAIELARHRLTPAHFNRCLMTGEMLPPAEAALAGFVDKVVPAEQLMDQARYAAHRLTQIDMTAHAGSKAKARGPALAALRAAIDAELTPEAFAAVQVAS